MWAPVVCPARREPGSRQPEQYALDRGVGQISTPRPPVGPISGETGGGQRWGIAFLLQSKVGRHDKPDQHLCRVAAPFQPPGGSRLFSIALMARVPYFASVLPHVVRMEPGLAEVQVPKWFFVYNHLHTVHAIASCNAAEVAMGMLMEATAPRIHR